MALLKSRPLTKLAVGFESLQLGESITFAEESLRTVLSYVNDSKKVEWVHREIILPVNKNRSSPLSRDQTDYIMQGQLAEDVGRKWWSRLSQRQRDQIYNAGSSSYLSENRDDFDSRTVFFRGITDVQVKEGVGLRSVIAAVKVYSLSGSWNLAEVRFWESVVAFPNINASRKYRGGELSVMTTVSIKSPIKESSPPKFLL